MLLEILGKLGFDWKVALANLVNFFIIFLLLKNVVFKKIGSAITERQEKIKKGLEDAESAKTALMMAESEKQEILKDSYKEARKITEDAEARGEKIVDGYKLQAGEEAQKVKEKALSDIESRKGEMEKDLQEKYSSLLVEGLEKVALQKIGKEESEEFTKSIINKTA